MKVDIFPCVVHVYGGGQGGVGIHFCDDGVDHSPMKIANIAIKQYGVSRVFLLGDVAKQPTHELAVLVGDLRDIGKREVIGVIEEDETLDAVWQFFTRIVVLVRSHKPVASRYNEIVLSLTGEPSSELIQSLPSNIPVSVIADTGASVPIGVKLVQSKQSWRFYGRVPLVLRAR